MLRALGDDDTADVRLRSGVALVGEDGTEGFVADDDTALDCLREF